jgi:flavin-dependent thymidylate synthase
VELLCKKCDVFVGFDADGIARRPEEHKDDKEWLATHCWVCGRSREEIEANPYDRTLTTDDVIVADFESGGRPSFTTTKPGTALSTFVDKAMFEAEPVEESALPHPKVYLLSATPDPLGAVAAYSMMYEGRVVRDLSEITDDERRHYFNECFKTALKTPLEAIDFHFMVEGMTRATFDQMRTQRTASFAGESLRFAVKDTFAESVRPGPLVQGDKGNRQIWAKAMSDLEAAYAALIGNGVPAEDARGLLPMNVLTRANWKSNLRNLEAEIGKRLCTQAQFEWRMLHADLRRAVREYDSNYKHPGVRSQFGGDSWDSSAWQFEYIAESPMFVPICFQKGACMFKASMDRGCTIRGRVDAGEFDKIKPEEWLMDPTAAWVK